MLEFEIREGNKSCKFINSIDVQIAEAFTKHFRRTCTSLNNDKNDRLRLLYLDKRHNHSVARQCYTVVRATQQVNGKWQFWGCLH